MTAISDRKPSIKQYWKGIPVPTFQKHLTDVIRDEFFELFPTHEPLKLNPSSHGERPTDSERRDPLN